MVRAWTWGLRAEAGVASTGLESSRTWTPILVPRMRPEQAGRPLRTLVPHVQDQESNVAERAHGAWKK